MCRQYLKSAVPPCIASADTSTHYEVTAVDASKEKRLFGYCIAHESALTIGFNEQIPEEDFQKLIPERLRKMMNHKHRRLEIRDPEVDELARDIRDAFNQLLYYYNQNNWVSI
jgi:hypothetical protein